MIFKSSSVLTILSTSVLLTIPVVAQAKDIENYEDYQLYCSPQAYQYNVQSPDCDKFRNIFKDRERELNRQQLPSENATEKQNNRRHKTGISGYTGATLGLFFPDREGLNNGLGGSIYGGVKFNKNFATDIELGILGGDTDSNNVNYGVWGLFINPRFILPLENKLNSASLFLSPGIGISQASESLELSNSDITIILADKARFTWQIKGGVSFPISRKFDLLGQLRYASQTEDDTVDFFGTEIGFNFKF